MDSNLSVMVFVLIFLLSFRVNINLFNMQDETRHF